MSGWKELGDGAEFELTATRALYWHGRDRHCCRSLWDVVERHVRPAGFEVRWKRPPWHFVVVSRADLVVGMAPNPIWQAVVAAPGRRAR